MHGFSYKYIWVYGYQHFCCSLFVSLFVRFRFVYIKINVCNIYQGYLFIPWRTMFWNLFQFKCVFLHCFIWPTITTVLYVWDCIRHFFWNCSTNKHSGVGYKKTNTIMQKKYLNFGTSAEAPLHRYSLLNLKKNK